MGWAILFQTVFFAVPGFMPSWKALGITGLVMGALFGGLWFYVPGLPADGPVSGLLLLVALSLATIGALCGLLARATSLFLKLAYMRGADAQVMAIGALFGAVVLLLALRLRQ